MNEAVDHGLPRSGESPHRMPALSVLLVGGDANQRNRLKQTLARRFALVESTDTLEMAAQLFRRCHFDFLVFETDGNPATGLDWASKFNSGCRIILAARHTETELVIAAMRAGISDIVSLPIRADELAQTIARHATGPAPQPARPPGRAGNDNGARLVGESPGIRQVKDLVNRIAGSPATVLIQGETGTGKELVARLLHKRSNRGGSFVPVNCGAIAPELMESELFGHTRGAFTNAHQGRDGLFVSARGGTVFLDEISEMPFEMEVKLLRAIEENAIRPVGADRETPIDCRIVASTQHELSARIKTGRFREDLYYRLNVIHIDLPPLRERGDDIGLLAEHFLDTLSRQLGVPHVAIDKTGLEALQAHHWPGNVRELKNVIERTLLLGIPPEQSLRHLAGPGEPEAGSYGLDWTLERVKQHHMRRVLEASQGNKSEAARRLGISRKTLERKLPG